MPLYDYECTRCGHQFERRQGFDADPVEVCPKCQGQARRQFHSVTVIYKGSGFYTTDYNRKHYSVPDSSSDGASADASSSTKDASSSTTSEKAQKEVKSSEE